MKSVLEKLEEAFEYLGANSGDEKRENIIEESVRRLQNLKRKRDKGFIYDKGILFYLEKILSDNLSEYGLDVEDAEKAIANQGFSYFLEIIRARKSKMWADKRNKDNDRS